MKETEFRIGIDNYGLFPLELRPLEVMEWALRNGADGVQFSGLTTGPEKYPDGVELIDLAQFARSHGMYLEWGGGQHIPFDTSSWEKRDIFEVNLRAAREAQLLGTRIVRSCSGGLFRWQPESPKTETLLHEMAAALRSQREMLRDFGVTLAIETHFEFTTYELLKLFEYCDVEPGDYLGICLDTMNLLIMLEDPVMATDRILPWVVSTHIKDGGLSLTAEGLVVYPVELGCGVVDIQKIVQRLSGLQREINLSVEDHGGDFKIPIYDSPFMSQFPDLTTQEFSRLVQTACRAEKRGLPQAVRRENWPEVCEARIRTGLGNLKQMFNL